MVSSILVATCKKVIKKCSIIKKRKNYGNNKNNVNIHPGNGGDVNSFKKEKMKHYWTEYIWILGVIITFAFLLWILI